MGKKANDDDGLVIAGGDGRPLQKRKRPSHAVCRKKLATFLEELAATCNVRKAAGVAGVSVTTIYKLRQRDGGFREQWKRALDQGYAALEAALLEQARAAVEAPGPETERTPVVGAMDARLALALLQNHQRSIDKDVGEVCPRRSDLPVAVERLERALKRFVRSGPDEAGRSSDAGREA